MAIPFARFHDNSLFSGILTGRYQRFPIRNRGVTPHFLSIFSSFSFYFLPKDPQPSREPRGIPPPPGAGEVRLGERRGFSVLVIPTLAFFTSPSLISRPQPRYLVLPFNTPTNFLLFSPQSTHHLGS
ncbi:hypothetical protein ACN38_g10353 [Penicillium nordicum]|uniref:Uncharacterized protein n=1 Tax=Penicillium nordicum TaxID=229535 RepID=A0A0N0RXX7_9EURO|nr:hypothetical protein ACN38_g10353 [Penicillium nordicum]